jgi:alpha-1,2-mannosyltransferase
MRELVSSAAACRLRLRVGTAPDAAEGSQSTVALAAFAVLLLGGFFALDHLFDFHVFWVAGRDVLHGRSPYPSLASIASDQRDYYVYPPPLALLMTPLALLPFPLAGAIFSAGLLAAMFFTLWILGVRDRNCYVVCLVWAATLQAIALGTVGPVLALLLAVAWRYRNRVVVCGLAVAAAVCLKVFLWPLLVWLLATRRLRSGLYAAVVGVAVTLAGWAAIGFAGLTIYPHLLEKLTSVEEARAFSLVALDRSLGLPGLADRMVLVSAGVASLAAIVALARREEGDRRSFSMAIAAALLLSPIVWTHYFCILVVPIAIMRKRMSKLWMIPALLALPMPHSSGNPLVILWGLGVAVAVFAVVLRVRPASLSLPWPRPAAPAPAAD